MSIDNYLPNSLSRQTFARNNHRMWRGSNILTFAMLICVNIFAGVVSAQQPPAAMEPALAQQAYQVAENWVRRLRVPDQSLAIPMHGLSAVYVTLRNQGPTVGQAVAMVSDPRRAGDAPPVDAMALLRSAMHDALKDMIQSLNQPMENLTTIAQQLELDIQFAGPLQPVHITQLVELPRKIRLDLDGLALFDGQHWAWGMPGNRIAANTNLQGQLNYLLGDLNLPQKQLAKIGQLDGPALYRFDVIHLVQLKAGAAAQSLYRGNMLWPQVPLDDASLRLVRSQLTDYLLRRYVDPGRFSGTYEPTADRYNPPLAQPIDSALTAFTLAKLSRVKSLSPEQRDKTLAALSAVVIDLTGQQQTLPEMSLTLLALLESPEAATLKGPRLRLATSIMRMQQNDGRFNEFDQTASRPATISANALAANALVAYYDRTRDPATLGRAKQALDAIWKHLKTRPGDFASTLPWLAYAETHLDRLGHAGSHHNDLRAAMDKLIAQQVKPWTPQQQQRVALDTVGGYALDTGLFNEPDWQSARVLTAQAVMLHDNSFIDDATRPQWLVSASLGARFIAQLTMQAPSCYYARNPTEAVGGARIAFWDNRQPLYASAMCLLATTELELNLAQ